MIIRLLVVLFLCPALHTRHLLQVSVLYRHGARNQVYKNWNWRQHEHHMHQLTAVGMRQHYILGTWLRDRYIRTTALLPEQYDPSQLQIYSSDYTR